MSTIASCVFTRFNALAIVYMVLVWFSASLFFQFKTSVMLEDDFPGDVASWWVRGDANNALISPDKIEIVPHSNTRTFLGKTYAIDRENIEKSYLLVNADIASKIAQSGDIKDSEISKKRPSLLYIWFGDKNGERLNLRFVSQLMPANQTIHASRIFHVPITAHTVNVELLLRKYQSQHELVSLDVRQIERTRAYKIVLGGLILVPLVALSLRYRKIRHQLPFFPIALIAAVALVLVIGVMMPGKPLATLISSFNAFVPQIKFVVQQYSAISIKDALHFLGFVFLTVVTLTINEKMQYRKSNILAKIGLFVVFTEVIQRHSIERSPSLFDIVIDMSGVVVGVLIWFSYTLVLSRWRQRSELA